MRVRRCYSLLRWYSWQTALGMCPMSLATSPCPHLHHVPTTLSFWNLFSDLCDFVQTSFPSWHISMYHQTCFELHLLCEAFSKTFQLIWFHIPKGQHLVLDLFPPEKHQLYTAHHSLLWALSGKCLCLVHFISPASMMTQRSAPNRHFLSHFAVMTYV